MTSASRLAGALASMHHKTDRVGQAALPPGWWQRMVTRLQQRHGRVCPAALPTPTAQQNLLVASAALGVAVVSVLVAPPLQLACLPAFLYLGVKPTQSAYQRWQQESRVTLAVAESGAVALCLVNGAWLIGSLGFSLYYLGQVVADESRKQAQPHATWQPPVWAWRQERDGEVITPLSMLRVGDTIVVHTGEMTPIAGVVTQSTAWARTQDQTSPTGVKVSTGRQVEAAAIVLAGWIAVVVTAT